MQKNEKTILKVKSFFTSSEAIYTFSALFVLLLAFLVQYFVNKPNLGVFLSSDMDPAGNIFVLGVDTSKDQFKVTKLSKGGTAKFSIDLEKSTNEIAYSYSNIEADSKGNFYIIRTERDLEAVVSDKSLYPILKETVLMYDPYGALIKEVATMDFSKQGNPPVDSYVKKIQLVDQSMVLICCKNNIYDIISVQPMSDTSPEKVNSFEIKPPTTIADQQLEWVSDMSVLSNGRVFYATKNGEFWAMNNQGEFVDYSNAISNIQFLITGMSVDAEDNIYFTDSLSGNFYKLDTKSIIAKNIYGLESKLTGDGTVLGKDVRKIKLVSDNDFYAPSKAFDKPFYVRFGNENHLTTDIHGSFFPWGLVIMALVCAAVIGVIYLARYLIKAEFKRIPLAVKIVSMFLPVYIVTMGILVYVNTGDSVAEYVSILKSEQERGAKTVADSISGSDFSNLDHVSDYMSTDYIKIRKSIEDGYADLSLKIGDRSDYLVTYIEKYGKLYATVNTKYAVSSSSYDQLKYAYPDMVASQCSLVDMILERSEAESLYDIWNQFSDKTSPADSLEASFKDVHGNMHGSFVAIKDDSGRIVGFVGNFLDANIHSSQEFWRIFMHSFAIILIVAVLAFAYLCFVIKYSLRPLKTIKKTLATLNEGKWDKRIKIKSKDEFADISQAFNLMSDKIERYTSNLVRLNEEYVRYVPTRLVNLLGKEKITQVKLNHCNHVNVDVIYVTFNLAYHGSYDFNSEEDVFEALNRTYAEVFKIIRSNGGVVQSFSCRDAVILFPGGGQVALKTSMQLKEAEFDPIIKDNMVITLCSGTAILGVAGNEERRGIIIASDEVMQLFNIDISISKIGINYMATKQIIDNITDTSLYVHRFIGRVKNITGEGYTEVFEIIDPLNVYKKDLYISTKEVFENGVRLYISGDFENARNAFADVLRVNENDKVAVHYLMKCGQEIDRFGSNLGSGSGKFKGYII